MQWKVEDVHMYVKAREYVDTLLIPMTPISYGGEQDELKSLAFQSEFLSVFLSELEKSFKGRVFLSPSYTYSTTSMMEEEIKRLNSWCERAIADGFQHVFLFTLDSKWKVKERELNGSLMWIPTGGVDSIHTQEGVHFVQSQIGQVTELITSYWKQ
ncbi:DUF2487 family protein [Pontibacillus litoralis]|uniref:DUF2487 domain-containing protein n=1 Tax=Pontibacillus litoralis JSM 072002 TaxID=1385512 RepID=A0A0A5G7C1_9BACI|nr:DUF2487 family protein [Pontibacillus litoralis]KGX87954.1 hypothetical protein N784_12720 [Pontibacillus litoralis JSM 072002]